MIIQALVLLLSSADPNEAAVAIDAIKKMKLHSKPVVQALSKTSLKNPHVEIRSRARDLLERFIYTEVVAAEKILPTFEVMAAQDPVDDMRQRAAYLVDFYTPKPLKIPRRAWGD